MKTKSLTAYQVDDLEIIEQELLEITGLFKEPVYFFKGETSTATSYFFSELEGECNIYLNKEDALNNISEMETNEFIFLQKAKDFVDFCKKTQNVNPFIEIGENNIKNENINVINSISDSVLKYYVNSKLSKNIYENAYIRELNKYIKTPQK